jgi:hypothetical protein
VAQYEKLKGISEPIPNALLVQVNGGTEGWERVKELQRNLFQTNKSVKNRS